MTIAARITQADMDRATKAVMNAKIDRARIVMDLVRGRIEVIIGEGGTDSPSPTTNPWTDE